MNAIAFPREQLEALGPIDLVALNWQLDWRLTARPNQLAPEGDEWDFWGAMAGRGFGKTRLGAQWLAEQAWNDPENLPKAVIAPTQADVRFVCFEGPAGLMNIVPPELVAKYNATDLILTLVNGAEIRGFSAEKADRLRGPQHSAIWCDEIAAWQRAEATWDMAMFGLRLGQHPRAVWTTTPKPVPIITRLTKAKRTIITRGTTYENRANLAPTFFRQLEQYEGTTLGRQELEGELIDPKESGVIRQSWLRLWPADKPLPEFQWIIMSLDTAFTEATMTKGSDGLTSADPTACSVWGVFQHEKRSNALMLDCWQEMLGFPDLIKRVKKELNVHYGDDQDRAMIRPMFGSDKPLTSGRKPDMLIIEDKGSGISLRQALTRDNIFAYAYNPGRADKLSRLHMVSPVFARRQVWVPESAKMPGQPRTWAMPLIAQLCSYSGPGTTKHDDFVDTVSQAFRVLLDKTIMSAVRKPTEGKEPIVPPPPKYSNPYAA